MNNENIYPSFKYQLKENIRPFLFYCLAFAALEAVGFIFLEFAIGYVGMNKEDMEMGVVTGGSGAAPIMFFILSLCVFRECFELMLQNGVSRRSMFAARLAITLLMSLVFAVADMLFNLLQSCVFTPLFGGQSYPVGYILGELFGNRANPFMGVLRSFVLSFFALLFMGALGYGLSVLFYQLGKWARIAVFGGGAVLVFMVLPLLSVAPNPLVQAVVSALSAFAKLAFGSMPASVFTYTILFVLTSGLTWLLLRRTPMKAA